MTSGECFENKCFYMKYIGILVLKYFWPVNYQNYKFKCQRTSQFLIHENGLKRKEMEPQ
jgi:hypothetical protein